MPLHPISYISIYYIKIIFYFKLFINFNSKNHFHEKKKKTKLNNQSPLENWEKNLEKEKTGKRNNKK
jgi:hypothetical protein